MTSNRPIGRGATAEIYPVGEDRVLKLFREGFDRAIVRGEYESAREAEECGIVTPRALELTERDGRCGIVYERARGQSMLRKMLLPWKSDGAARLLAELQAEMNRRKPRGLPSFRQRVGQGIRAAEGLSEPEKRAVLARLDSLPDGDGFCHGDFHPDNILLTRNGPVILDWMTACRGDPAADAARTVLILGYSEPPDQIPARLREGIRRKQARIVKIYRERYGELSGLPDERIDAWMPPLMAARLAERRPPAENRRLTEEIRRRLGGEQTGR